MDGCLYLKNNIGIIVENICVSYFQVTNTKVIGILKSPVVLLFMIITNSPSPKTYAHPHMYKHTHTHTQTHTQTHTHRHTHTCIHKHTHTVLGQLPPVMLPYYSGMLYYYDVPITEPNSTIKLSHCK